MPPIQHFLRRFIGDNGVSLQAPCTLPVSSLLFRLGGHAVNALWIKGFLRGPGLAFPAFHENLAANAGMQGRNRGPPNGKRRNEQWGLSVALYGPCTRQFPTAVAITDAPGD